MDGEIVQQLLSERDAARDKKAKKYGYLTESQKQDIYNNPEALRAMSDNSFHQGSAWSEEVIDLVPDSTLDEDYGTVTRQELSMFEKLEQDGVATIGNNYLENVRDDEEAGFKRVRQLTNDLARLDSMDQAVIDMIDRHGYTKNYKSLMTAEEANQYSKQAGVDLKWDKKKKKITEGEVMYAIAQKKKREALEQEIAFFRETGDYNAFQNIRLIGSALAGSMGPGEFALTTGLSLLGAPVWAASSTKLVGAARIANNVRKGAYMYNKHKQLQAGVKLATRLKHEYAALKTAGTLKESVPLTFAIDGVMSDLPRVAAISLNSELKNDNSYNLKDATTELLTVGVMGAGLGKGVSSLQGKVAKEALNQATQGTQEQVAQAMVTGRLAQAKAINEEAVEKVAQVKQVIEKANDTLNPEAAAQYMQKMQECSKLNLTDDEIVFITEELYRRAKQGLPLNVLDRMPFRTTYYSNLTGCLDSARVVAEENLPNNAFYKLMEWQGWTPAYKGTKELSGEEQKYIEAFTTQLGDISPKQAQKVAKRLPEMFETLKFLKTGEHVSVTFAEEGGALGKTTIKGMSKAQAERIHVNITKALMLDGTEAGLVAREAAEKEIAGIIDLRNLLKEVADTYETIVTLNNNARKQGLPKVFKYKVPDNLREVMYSQEQYMTREGTFVSLVDILGNDISFACLPADLQAFLKKAEGVSNEYAKGAALVGHAAGTEEENVANFISRNLVDWKNEVIGTFGDMETSKTDGCVYFNLSHKAGAQASETDTKAIRDLIDKLDEIARDDISVLNSDHTFIDSYGQNPEKLVQLIESGSDIPELGYSYAASSPTYESVIKMIGTEEGVVGRRTAAVAKVDLYNGTGTEESLDKIADIIQGQTKSGKRLAGRELKFIANNREIEAINKILEANLGESKSGLVDAIQESKFLSKMAKITTDLTPRAIARLVTDERQAFREIINKSLLEPIKAEVADWLPSGQLNDAIDEAVDNFIIKLHNMDQSEFGNMFEKATVAPDEKSPEVITQTLENQVKQKKAYNEILAPLVKEIGTSLANYQVTLLNNKANTLRLWSECLRNPGRMDEVILKDLSGTYLGTKNAAVSIESLSSTQKEYSTFMAKLNTLDTGREVEPLATYAYNPANFEDIRENVHTILLLENGMLSKEEELAFQAGTQAARVARAYVDTMAGLQQDLVNVGAGKKTIISLFDRKKLRSLPDYLEGVDYQGNPLFEGMKQYLSNERADKDIAKYFQAFYPAGTSKQDMAIANARIFLLDNLDLDNMLNKNGRAGVSLNELRDEMAKGTTTDGDVVTRLYSKYGEKKTKRALKILAEGIGDTPEQYGLLSKMTLGSGNISAEFQGHTAKYLNDLNFTLKFKNNEVTNRALGFLGYDGMREMFEGNASTAKRAYAILSKSSTEPFQFYSDIKEIARTYASDIAPGKFTKKEAKLVQERLGSASFGRKLEYLVNNVCGTYTSPATTLNKVVRLAMQVLGSPLIMASAAKGMTDYPYMFQYLVSSGLYQGGDIGARARILSRAKGFLIPGSKEKRLAANLFIGQQLGLNTLYEAVTNGQSLVSAGSSVKDIIAGFQGKGLSKYASGMTRAEGAAKSWTNAVMGMGGVTQAAEYNRTMAALTTMQAIGENANIPFKEMNDSLKITLNRYGIDEFEWDNIFRAQCIKDSDSFISEMAGEGAELFGEGNMFIPDAMLNIDDATVENLMRAQPDKFNLISPETVKAYKNNLIDKACMLINTSADEMTSIPNARIQGELLLFNDPNTRSGAVARALTQFQSFGASMCWYSWTRRWMSFADPTDLMLNSFILGRTGWGKPTTSMVGFISEMAMAQWMVNEALSVVTGKHQKLTNEHGEVQPDRVAKKLGKALVDQAGLAGVVLDTVMGLAGSGAGSGGGLAVPVAPVPASTLYGAVKVGKAMAREENEGRRLQAGAAQVGLNTFETLGIARHPLLQATYARFIGDKFGEAALGAKGWKARQRRREREGYQRNYMYDVTDFASDLFTN